MWLILEYNSKVRKSEGAKVEAVNEDEDMVGVFKDCQWTNETAPGLLITGHQSNGLSVTMTCQVDPSEGKAEGQKTSWSYI